METVYKLANGEEVPAEIILDFILITQDNVDDFLS